MKLDKKKLLMIAGGLAVVGVGYYLYQRRSAAPAPATATPPNLNPGVVIGTFVNPATKPATKTIGQRVGLGGIFDGHVFHGDIFR